MSHAKHIARGLDVDIRKQDYYGAAYFEPRTEKRESLLRDSLKDAIRRMEDGTYGICESCENGIERARLRALPFAKKCMVCQNASERGRTRYRPFGGTLPLQQMAIRDATDAPDMN